MSKSAMTQLLIVFFAAAHAAIGMTCREAASDTSGATTTPKTAAAAVLAGGSSRATTVVDLDLSWRQALWRVTPLAAPTANFAALERVMNDQDLHAQADTWMELARTYVSTRPVKNSAIAVDHAHDQETDFPDSQKLEILFRYLQFLGDTRIKNDVPFGGYPEQPKPLLTIFELAVEAHKDGLKHPKLWDALNQFLNLYVDPVEGYRLNLRFSAVQYTENILMPMMNRLGMAFSYLKN